MAESTKVKRDPAQQRDPAAVTFKKGTGSKDDWRKMDSSVKGFVEALDWQLQHEKNSAGQLMYPGSKTDVTSGIDDKKIQYMEQIPKDKRHLYKKNAKGNYPKYKMPDGTTRTIRDDTDYAHRSGFAADIVFRNRKGVKLSKAEHNRIIEKVVLHMRKKDREWEKYRYEVHGGGDSMHGHLSTRNLISRQAAKDKAVDYGFLLDQANPKGSKKPKRSFDEDWADFEGSIK